jgi:hypothetical protein
LLISFYFPVTWAREAEVKHGRICMLASLGAIVQDVYTFPFMDKWYNGEKVWGLHDAAIKSGALWQARIRFTKFQNNGPQISLPSNS